MKRPMSFILAAAAFSIIAATTASAQEADAGASASASQRAFVACSGGPQEFVNGGTQNAAIATGAVGVVLPSARSQLARAAELQIPISMW